VVELESLLRFKTDKVNKRCEVDYYGVLLEDLLIGIITHLKSASVVCGSSLVKGKDLRESANSCLEVTEKSFIQDTE
jgi:hypothetical protein